MHSSRQELREAATINRDELQEHSNAADVQVCRGTKGIYPTLRKCKEK